VGRWDRDKRALQEKHSECRKATGILSDEVKYKPPEAWQAKFDLLGSSDINVLGAMLEEQDGELSHIRSIPDKVIEDIEALVKKLEQARKEKDDLEEEIKNKNHSAMKLRRKWITGVETLVEKINDRFGTMMAALGYAGQVSLKQGDRDIDFSSYGVQIQVLFQLVQLVQSSNPGAVPGGAGAAGAEQGHAERRGEERHHGGLHDGAAGADPGPLPLRGRDQPGDGRAERARGVGPAARGVQEAQGAVLLHGAQVPLQPPLRRAGRSVGQVSLMKCSTFLCR
jgi:hypothetical protein